MKTIEECRQEVAKELGYNNWNTVIKCLKAFNSTKWLCDQYDKAAEKYAEQFKCRDSGFDSIPQSNNERIYYK